MRVYLTVRPNKQKTVLQKIKKLRNVKRADIFTDNTIIAIINPISSKDAQEQKKLQNHILN